MAADGVDGVEVDGAAAGGPRLSSAGWLRARCSRLRTTGMAMVLTTRIRRRPLLRRLWLWLWRVRLSSLQWTWLPSPLRVWLSSLLPLSLSSLRVRLWSILPLIRDYRAAHWTHGKVRFSEGKLREQDGHSHTGQRLGSRTRWGRASFDRRQSLSRVPEAGAFLRGTAGPDATMPPPCSRRTRHRLRQVTRLRCSWRKYI